MREAQDRSEWRALGEACWDMTMMVSHSRAWIDSVIRSIPPHSDQESADSGENTIPINMD
ncbi:hypothetical protein MSG28_013833 [Choristoneura fumiferana]|uniref:Uncharacterized protein n=1 Tax=Choristoneura fumiferana TaxID=7141 RepID=A0ACC0K946_CHOFU|nr:hypothetical protein MSG28_013833 [Choristoneura fumiferana]